MCQNRIVKTRCPPRFNKGNSPTLRNEELAGIQSDQGSRFMRPASKQARCGSFLDRPVRVARTRDGRQRKKPIGAPEHTAGADMTWLAGTTRAGEDLVVLDLPGC